MASGEQLVQEFISEKSRTGNRAARQLWHGQFLSVERSSDITINMFLQIENHLYSRGWSPYGWAAKRKDIARRLYSNGVTVQDYTIFPAEQNHWDAFYCSPDWTVALGYWLPGHSLLRVYISRTKVGNLWLSGTHLGRNVASAMMFAAKLRRPPLSFFGLTGPQSKQLIQPETAMFGSAIRKNTLCIPLPESITPEHLGACVQFSKTVQAQERPYNQFEQFLASVN